MMQQTQPLIEAHDLVWKSGGAFQLGPLNLPVRAGECVAIVGPNGAGKTTLLRLLGGLLAATGGRVEWQGGALSAIAARERARRIAYVPQVRVAEVPLTVEQMVLLGRYPHLSRWQFSLSEKDYEATRQALRRVEATELAQRSLSKLSGGEQQAVHIAAALAQEAQLLLLDEPTTHLDAGHQRDIAALIGRLHRQQGLTVVFATHDLNVASLLADRVVAIVEGRIRCQGPPASVLTQGNLHELFGVPFEIVRGGERPITLLELEP